MCVTNNGIWRRALVAIFCLVMVFGMVGTTAADSAETVSFDLVIQDHQLSGAENTVRLHQGDKVELRWLSDAPAAVHLHGYDIELHLHAGEMAVMAFEAEATGRFPVELHGGHGHGALLYVEVYPR